jgi:hypothetical protein
VEKENMTIGKIFKVRLYVRGVKKIKYGHKWCVLCKNCMKINISLFSKKDFIECMKHEGWFKVKGKWSCGRHGDVEDGNVRDKEWRVEEVSKNG